MMIDQRAGVDAVEGITVETKQHHRRRDESTGDESGSHHRHRSSLKSDKFNGQGSFETFLIQFENCAEYNKWNSKDKLANLRWSLAGTAAQLLFGSELMTYEQLIERLQRRFGGKDIEEKFQC